MEATVETKPRHPKDNSGKRINYALAGTLLHSGMPMEEIAKRVGASNANSLRTGLSKRGVTRGNAMAVMPHSTHTAIVASKAAHEASEILKEELGVHLSSAVRALGERKVKYKDLASRGQGHMATLKTATEAYKALYGSADANVIVFGAGNLESAPQPQPVASEANPAIDIDAQPS